MSISAFSCVFKLLNLRNVLVKYNKNITQIL